MYSKQEASQVRQEFWTVFGKYMQPVLSAEGEKINWINYKTGVKNIHFRMNAAKGAMIGIEVSHPKIDEQLQYYDRFVSLQALFKNTLQEEWTWAPKAIDENGKMISRIYTELFGVHVFNKADWPAIISFFKPRIIGLDAFWTNVKPGFEL